MAMEDELENQNAGGGADTAAASATPPPPAPVGAGVAAPAGVAANSDPAMRAGAQMVGSAIDAATAPGQSVTDAANAAATESELRGVAQAVTAADRYKANQNGMTSPPSAWAQDVNDLYAGLTRAAQRSAERLAQGQQRGSDGQQQQQAPMQPASTPDDPFAISSPKQASAAQPIQKSGKMVFGAQQNFASAAQERANEFVGGYFA